MNAEQTAQFESFYQKYPRKKSRGDAEKAWGQALKKGFTPEEIMTGLERNIQSLKSRDPQFVPYPATWLRAQGWFDEPDTVKTRSHWRGDMADFTRSLMEETNGNAGMANTGYQGAEFPLGIPSPQRQH